jgi:hypothetical protein
MLEKINLFPRVEAIWETKARIRRLVQIASILALIFNFVFVSAILSYFLLLANQESDLQAEIGSYEQKIKGLKSVETKQVFLKSKLKELAKVFKIGKVSEEILDDFESLDSEGISFQKINYQEGALIVEAEAQNVLVFDKFVKDLEIKGESLFSQVDFERVMRTPKKKYNFSLRLVE